MVRNWYYNYTPIMIIYKSNVFVCVCVCVLFVVVVVFIERNNQASKIESKKEKQLK